MKIAIIGAGGIRTPLIVESIFARQDRLGIHELALMDIDKNRLELIGALSSAIEKSSDIKFRIIRTTDSVEALENADFVITTFRVGGIESRAIDERVPLSHGILGQETTGPGGFAMGVRSIPVLLDYIKLMRKHCPGAWLINFANPAGMLTEAVIRQTGWSRVVGICDAPSSMHRTVASILNANLSDVFLDYFGLNHLGWIKRIIYHNKDYLPPFLNHISSSADVPGLPFDSEFIFSLHLIPNEYLYFYYYNHQAVNNISKAGKSRGEQIAELNSHLFRQLREQYNHQDINGMYDAYKAYMKSRGETYMVNETGRHHGAIIERNLIEPFIDEGYAGVALNLIEGIGGNQSFIQILNVPNHGVIDGMGELDVVEIPCYVKLDQIVPIPVGEIPEQCLGLMKQVKYFEHLTIEAAMENSYKKARMALTVHPLVRDHFLAGKILDEYISQHKSNFPVLH